MAPSEEVKPTSISISVLGPSVHGLDIQASVVNYTLTFVEPAQSSHVYHVVSTMCKKVPRPSLSRHSNMHAGAPLALFASQCSYPSI